MYYKLKRSKRKSPLFITFVISLLLHLLILILLSINKELLFPKVNITPEKKDSFIEISEIPVPINKETEPPEETKRLAERSRKVEKEKTIDEFTKKGSTPSIPKIQIPREKKTEVAKKVETKNQQTTKKETIKHKDEEKDVKIASIPKYDKPDLQTPEKSDKTEPEQKRKDITKEDLFRTAQIPFPPSNQQQISRNFSGTRNLPREDTVDLNTTEYKYLSYFLKLKRQIEGVWNYPKESRLRGEQGELLLVFTLRSDGYLENVKLLEPSGYVRLDEEAIRAIRVAAPFSPFPSSWKLDRLNINAVFLYKFGWSFR